MEYFYVGSYFILGIILLSWAFVKNNDTLTINDLFGLICFSIAWPIIFIAMMVVYSGDKILWTKKK